MVPKKGINMIDYKVFFKAGFDTRQKAREYVRKQRTQLTSADAPFPMEVNGRVYKDGRWIGEVEGTYVG